MLIALLTFFGLKDEVLDQALRRNPLPTLCVFLMLGLGVLCSLFAGAIQSFVRVRLWAVLFAILMLLSITATTLPNLVLPGRNSKPLELAGCSILALVLVLAAAVCLTTAYDETQSGDRKQSYDKKQSSNETPSGDQSQSRKRPLILVFVGLGLLVGAGLMVYVAARLTTPTAVYTVLGGLALVLAIGWAFASRAALHAMAAIIILGVASTALGLYGAFKVTVESKMAPVEPQVSAWLEETAGRDNIKIAASASRSHDRRLEVIVWGQLRRGEFPTAAPLSSPIPSCGDGKDALKVFSATAAPSDAAEIWRGVLQPDALDEIDTTLTVPIAPTRWELVAVAYRELERQEGGEFCATADNATTVLRRRNAVGDVGMEMDGSISADGPRNLKVMVAGRNIPWGTWVTLELCRINRAGHRSHLATETLTPTAAGEVSWSASVPSGRVGEGLVLQYKKTCGWNEKACIEDQIQQLAKYNNS